MVEYGYRQVKKETRQWPAFMSGLPKVLVHGGNKRSSIQITTIKVRIKKLN